MIQKMLSMIEFLYAINSFYFTCKISLYLFPDSLEIVVKNSRIPGIYATPLFNLNVVMF